MKTTIYHVEREYLGNVTLEKMLENIIASRLREIKNNDCTASQTAIKYMCDGDRG